MSKSWRAAMSLFLWFCGVVVLCTASPLGCGRTDDHETGSVRNAIINGTPIADAGEVEAIKVVHVQTVAASGGPPIAQGSGTPLTNDWVLTAGHVVHLASTCSTCSVDLTLGDIAQGHQTRKADRFLFHPRFRAIPDVFAPGGFRYPPDTDIAFVHVASPFSLGGSTSAHSRPISDLNTANLIAKSSTCFGYGRSELAGTAGPPLRSASFLVRPYPAPPPYASAPSMPHAFTVMKGGGLVHDDSGSSSGIIPHSGDSGGPCIDPTDPFVGQENVWGVMQSIEIREKANPTPPPTLVNDPRFAVVVAASAFRDFARSVLAAAAPPIQFDINLDGLDDTFFIREIGNFLFVEVQLGGNKGTFTLPPGGIPKLTLGDNRSLVQTADFNDDGTPDLFGYLNGSALYFHGASGFTPSFPPPTSIQLASQYEYFTPGDVNGDGVSDLTAVRANATEDVYLGEQGTGLSVPGHFVPRGFNWYGPPDQEAFIISAPGSEISVTSPGGNFETVIGRAYFTANLGGGFEVSPLTLDAIKTLSGKNLSASFSGDLFGTAVAWGNFDGSTSNHAMVISAPGVTVGQPRAGIVTYVAYDPSFSCPVPPDPTDQCWVCPQGPIVAEQVSRQLSAGETAEDNFFGSELAAGDFNGDGRDDLAVVSRLDLQVLDGVSGSGISSASPRKAIKRSDVGLQSPFSRLSSGDFNCDGFEDLAIGAPIETVSGVAGAGAVVILYGSKAGLTGTLSQRLDESTSGISTNPQPAGFFGTEVTAGNFNGDSFAGRPCIDLAIGTGEGGGSIGHGSVHVLFGGSDGLTGAGSQHLVQGGAAAGGSIIMDSAEEGDAFGGFMAITRADLDRFDDLIIGAWNENLAEGAAHVLRGSSDGITAVGQGYWRQGDPTDIPETPETPGGNPFAPGDRFGWTVGGTSNGLAIVGASWESFTAPAPTNQAGWAALIRTDDSNMIGISKAFAATETSLTTLATPSVCSSPFPVREDAFFGSVISRARPAFVARKAPPDRYSGALTPIVASGTFRAPCQPDETAPFIGAVIAPACVWPPNQRLVRYSVGEEIAVTVNDNCDPHPQVRVLTVTSSEPGTGDFVFSNDSLCLRAEREGAGSGRTYTITLEARDASGNSRQASVHVTVPKSGGSCSTSPKQMLKDGDPACLF